MARALHLYVHVPFCARKCPYCHFYNLGHDDGREALYLDALAREIAALRERGALEGVRLAALYWGGGTPSMLSPAGFERAADLCLGTAPIGGSWEWTLEANPDDVGPGNLARWRARGVTRLSVGAQSFDDRRLRFLGRVHDGARARAAVEEAAAAGFDELSLDLIFGLAVPDDPSERRRVWRGDLATALALPITHLSLYGLTIEPGTAFHARERGGEALLAPDPASAAEYALACRAARRAGFEHYEVSSFALPGHRARHNAAYWSGVAYIGVGPAAHSFDGVRRWANQASLVGWAEALSTGGDPRAFVEMLTPAQRDLETLYLGLRTRDGVGEGHGLLTAGGAPALVERLIERDLLTREGCRVVATERGFAVLDAMLERLARAAGTAEPAGAAPGGESARRDR